MFDPLQHLPLIVGVLDLLHLHYLLLLQNLDRVEALVVFRLHQVYSPKTAGSQRSLYVEV